MPFKINKKEQLLEKYIEEPGVTEVIVPDGIQKIGWHAFKECKTILRVVLPESLAEIHSGAFHDCSDLAEIVFPESLDWIGASSFDGTPWLNHQTNTFVIAGSVLVLYRGTDPVVHIPEGIGGIGYGAFADSCAKVIYVPESASVFGGEFNSLTNLQEIYLPDSMTDLGRGNLFDFCKSLKKVVMSDRIEMIPDSTFSHCENLEEIRLPANLKIIDEHAFAWCKSLKRIAFPEGLREIGEDAFFACKSLSAPNFPSSLEKVGAYAYGGCDNIRNVVLPHQTIHLESHAFCCKGVEQITVPADCIVDPFDFSEAFSRLPSLRQINIDPQNKNLTVQNGFAYSKDMTILCKAPLNIETFQIPDSVKTIAAHAFSGCERLREIQIPDSVETIEFDAFGNCTQLRKIKIPNGVKTIESYAFCGCKRLREVQIPTSVNTLGEYVFGHCEALEEIVIPETVKEIPICAFVGCTNLKSVKLPQNLRIINCFAFERCKSLTSVTIPTRVNTLGESAFNECTALTDVTLPKNISNVFLCQNGHVYERKVHKSEINAVYMTVFDETPWLEEQEFYKNDD